MIQAGDRYISARDAAERLGVSVRRVYDLIKSDRLRARTLAGRHLVDANSVLARRLAGARVGRPFSPRRAWGLILLADGGDPEGLDPVTKSKLRRLLRERDLWEMRSSLGSRAERLELRAHPSDLQRIEREPGLVMTGARYAAKARIRLHSPDAAIEFYVDQGMANELVSRYRLKPGDDPNVVLHVVPNAVRPWLKGLVAPRTAVALDLAGQRDARSQNAARDALARM